MDILIACDSFKGTLSSSQCARIIEKAAGEHIPGCRCRSIAMADGGEGTVEAVVAAMGGRLVTTEVAGPLGDPVRATWGLLPDQSAVIEMAAASGLPLVAGREDPLAASSLGTGQLMVAALDAGCRSISLAIGGSATNDGGMGALHGLGARFLDEQGRVLEPCGAALERVRAVDLAALDPRLGTTELTIMGDVDNPLLGPHGATRTFGPQKGADPKTVERLEAAMATYAVVLEGALDREVAALPGAGAAGGLGAACLALGATMVSGCERVLELVGFDSLLAEADLVVTGEGHGDAQTARGKVISGVATACQRAGVPCVAVVGAMDADAARLPGLAAMVPCVIDACDLADALAHSERNLRLAAERLFSLIALGMGLA